VQATLEAVDGSRLGGFFVQIVPLADCSGVKEFLYAVVDAKMHLNLYGWLHLVRGSAEMRDEVGTAMRPWTIMDMVVWAPRAHREMDPRHLEARAPKAPVEWEVGCKI